MQKIEKEGMNDKEEKSKEMRPLLFWVLFTLITSFGAVSFDVASSGAFTLTRGYFYIFKLIYIIIVLCFSCHFPLSQ